MYISDKMIKKAGLFPSGKYDAVINHITERHVEDHLGKLYPCWYFYIDLLKDEKWYPYAYCMKCGINMGPECLSVFEDLKQVMNLPYDIPRSDDIRNLCVSIKLGCTIDASSAFFKTASIRNIILKIDKTHIDENLLKKRISTYYCS